MAEETETTTEEGVTEPVVETEGKTHPLAPGGVRFEDVVREKNEYKAEAAALRAQVARQQEPPKDTPAQTPTFYSTEQLQAAVDAGRITHTQASDQLAWQRAEQMRQQVGVESDLRQKRAAANAEVNQYLDRVPALHDPTSKEFLRASRAATEIAEDLGADIRDPRVQRQALRQIFGSIDKLADASKTRDYAREHADTAIETRGGGSRQPPKNDPFKDVPKALLDHWDHLRYTDEQKKEELKYVDLARWKRKYG
jgi:hypothetical protein